MNWYKLTHEVIPAAIAPVLSSFVSTVNFSMICEEIRFIIALKYDSKCKFVIKSYSSSVEFRVYTLVNAVRLDEIPQRPFTDTPRMLLLLRVDAGRVEEAQPHGY